MQSLFPQDAFQLINVSSGEQEAFQRCLWVLAWQGWLSEELVSANPSTVPVLLVRWAIPVFSTATEDKKECVQDGLSRSTSHTGLASRYNLSCSVRSGQILKQPQTVGVCVLRFGRIKSNRERKSRRAGRLLFSSFFFQSMFYLFTSRLWFQHLFQCDPVTGFGEHTRIHTLSLSASTGRSPHAGVASCCLWVFAHSHKQRTEVTQGAWTQSHIAAAFRTLFITAPFWLLSFV